MENSSETLSSEIVVFSFSSFIDKFNSKESKFALERPEKIYSMPLFCNLNLLLNGEKSTNI